MKPILALVLLAVLGFAVAGCGSVKKTNSGQYCFGFRAWGMVREMRSRTAALLLAIVVLAGCGSGRRTTISDRIFLDRNTLEAQVKTVGNVLLRQHSKLSRARPRVHIRDVTCVKSEGDRWIFQCRLSYSSGDHKTLGVLVSPEGSGWRFVPRPRQYVPRQHRV